MKDNGCLVVLLGLLLLGTFALVLAWLVNDAQWRTEAIQHGAMRYNPTTGVAEWVERKPKP